MTVFASGRTRDGVRDLPSGSDALTRSLRASLEFEALTGELLSRFVDIPSWDIDSAIGTAQERLCHLLDLDLSTVWQWTPGSQRFMKLTHLHRPPGGPPVPDRGDAEELLPWCLGRLLAKQPVILSSVDDFPPEAVVDRETHLRFGAKATVGLPLSTGGGPVLGIVSFTTTREERAWPVDVIRRLELITRIFAAALGRKATDEALRESEERLQLAAESAGVGLWRFDLATSTFWVTDHTRRQHALPAEGPVTFDRFLGTVAQEDRASLLESIAAARAGEKEESVEYRVLSTQAGERWLSSRGRVRGAGPGGPDSVMGVTLDVTERRRSESALRDLSQRLIRAHEEERALLARELHDDLTQRLAVLAIEIGRAELAASSGAQAETLRAARESLVALSEDVHSLAYQLHPSVLEDLGLAEALRTECERFQRQCRTTLTTTFEPLTAVPGADAALCLFRVAQEALRNVARHSGARTAALALRKQDGGFLLAVNDDGAGFDPAVQKERRSLGLASMRERVQLVGGTLRIFSAPGQGTTISAWIPAKETTS